MKITFFSDFSKQQKIGLVSFFGFFSLFLLNLVTSFFYGDSIGCYNTSILNIYIFSILSILSIVTIFKNSNIFKLLQIGIYFLVSIIAAVLNNSISDITSLAFFIYSIVLIWVYFKNKIKLRYIVFFNLFLIIFITGLKIFLVELFSAFVNNTNCVEYIDNMAFRFILSIVATFIFFGTYFSLLWVTLADEIKYLFEKSNKLQIALYKSESDAWYGRNVIGVVHNIKNKLTPVYLLLEEFSHDERIDKEMRDFCRTQIRSVDGLSGLLDKLMYSTKIKNKEDLETININKTVRSVVEFFKSNLEFKKNINLSVKHTGPDVHFKGNPMNFCFVIENIIKNSYDSLKTLSKIKKIEIEIINKEDIKYISIKDNGTGIKIMKEDEFSGSLLDCHFFKIGNTTKKNGLGYGMEFIKSFIVENKLEADIYSKKGFGTEIKIIFK